MINRRIDRKQAQFFNISRSRGRDAPDTIRQRGAIFRFSLTANFDLRLSFLNI
jgi:hypothetical protein